MDEMWLDRFVIALFANPEGSRRMNQPQSTASTVNLPEKSPSGTLIERVAALVEVVVVFVVVHLSYRSLKHFTELGRLEGAAGLNFSAGSVMILFTVAMLSVDYFNGRWDFAWWWWLPTFVTGVFYGCLREKSGSVLAGGVHHGVMGVMAEVPALLP
jgi:membrane protease YdiL (CAAX protease family)